MKLGHRRVRPSFSNGKVSAADQGPEAPERNCNSAGSPDKRGFGTIRVMLLRCYGTAKLRKGD